MTGSSAVWPSFAKNARTSNASGEPAGYGPTTPRSKSTNPGSSASTASALSSSATTQFGPFAAHCASTIASRSIRRTSAIRRISASSTGPLRNGSGDRNARPSVVRRTVTSPAPHSWTIRSPFRGRPPAASHAWHVPSVGWPANGNSLAVSKMRTA